jgi:hypothetical protein
MRASRISRCRSTLACVAAQYRQAGDAGVSIRMNLRQEACPAVQSRCRHGGLSVVPHWCGITLASSRKARQICVGLLEFHAEALSLDFGWRVEAARWPRPVARAAQDGAQPECIAAEPIGYEAANGDQRESQEPIHAGGADLTGGISLDVSDRQPSSSLFRSMPYCCITFVLRNSSWALPKYTRPSK